MIVLTVDAGKRIARVGLVVKIGLRWISSQAAVELHFGEFGIPVRRRVWSLLLRVEAGREHGLRFGRSGIAGRSQVNAGDRVDVLRGGW